MAEKRLLDVDPLTGTAQYSAYDESADAFHYHQEVDATPLQELNRKFYNDAPAGWGEGRHVARLPMVLWLKLYSDGTLSDPKRLRRWLNDPDNRDFRVRPGWV
jgi:hypothetical protein